MAAHRYWRLVGFATYGGAALELSEARLYASGSLADGSATLTCTVAPTTGALSDLRDGSTASAVSWAAGKYKASSFALVWDLTWSGASVDAVKIGSGASIKTFPCLLALQWSDDGAAWTSYDTIVGAVYPGAFSLSAPDTTGDPLFTSNSALLHFDGTDGSTSIVDVMGKTWTPANGAALSTGWAGAFGGTSLSLGGSKWLSTPQTTDMDFGADPFTISLRVNLRTNSGTEYRSFVAKDNISVTRGWLLLTLIAGDGGAGFLGFTAFVGATVYAVIDTVALATGTPIHIVIGRDNGYLRLYKEGVQIAQTAITGSINAPDIATYMGALCINGSPQPNGSPDAYIDELRICKGALYPNGTTFTPPSAPWSDFASKIMAIDTSAPKSTGNQPVRALRIPGSTRPDGAAYRILSTRTFADVYNGGWGIVAGTVKQKGTPVNTPLRRKVVLIDEQSRLVIRETWSDAITGAYEFRGVKAGVPYTVLSYDHTGVNFPAVVDRQYAELMSS